MVWGCMSARGVGKLCFLEGTVNASKYQQILENELLPSIPKLQSPEKEYIFQQDNASCHTARSTKSWLAANNIPLMEWPANSPDLSPIESLWGKMKQSLRKNPARTLEELRIRLQEIWDSITQEDCQKLVFSMPDRMKSTIKRKGDVTQW